MDYLGGLDDGIAGLRIGIPRALIPALGEPSEQMAALEDLCASLRNKGASIVDPVDTPAYRDFVDPGLIVMLAESYDVHREILQSNRALYDPTHARCDH